ncbi:NAD-dependent epimerase/dehydratase family protein [Methanoculleus sp. FWC-SCC3]|uniref:NAD-dependent epimerase/dehydratase family protein n=1 Tax=Methanoculleus methanifontis TaxID=2584086 RepID=A0ABT8M5M2_9EURY|nr:NAD-dependent epimerase/dehydratase family protein [Methanoculleus sp. FWC-SCC3]MDN7013862.1 NAD-dependent epimerase/dehydratase family protein [Methanoculleus sp. FWC-SCC3]
MSKVVITGGAGFIGSHIAEEVAKEYEVVIIDNLDDYYSPDLKRRNLEILLANPNVRFVEGDITDTDLLRRVIDSDVEFVYHEAAQAGVRISVENPFKPNNVNVLGTLNVLKASLDAGVKRVINASSSSVYGKVKYLPFDEAHPTMPVSPYGVSKLAAEHYCRVFYEVYGLPTVSLRYFTVYGPRMRPDLAISIFARKMLANEPITVYGDGEQTRDFTYIDDIVRVNRGLLETNAADGHVMNVGGGHRITVNDLIAHLREITGSASEVVYSDKQKGDAEHTLADIGLAEGLVEYRPATAIADGLKKFVEWYTAHSR